MKLPVRIERMHGLYVSRISDHIHDLGISAISRHGLRQDADGPLQDRDIESVSEMAHVLSAFGLSMQTILNEDLLRQRLRVIAEQTNQNVKAQLAHALGRSISTDVSGDIDAWIEDQLFRIRNLLERWRLRTEDLIEEAIDERERERLLLAPVPDVTLNQATIGAAIATAAAGALAPGSPLATVARGVSVLSIIHALAEEKNREKRLVFFGAATGLLMLNSVLVKQNAVAAGANQFIWRTQLDDRVRDHHAALEGTIQSFDDPPLGGGTLATDYGLPQSGFNCRCSAEIILT